MIRGVAIKTKNGKVISLDQPCRHHHLIELVDPVEDGHFDDGEQGFITDKDEFLTRQEAVAYAKRWHNVTPKYQPDTLFSEDLW